MHHEREDAHLGSTAVVQLDGLLVVEVESACLLGDSRKVLAELLASLLDIGLAKTEAKLKETDEEYGLNNTSQGKGVEDSKASLHGAEGHARGDIEGQAVTGSGGDVTSDGKHRDAAMLDLNIAEAVEALLVGIFKQVEGIPKSERRLGTDLGLEAHLKGRRCSNAPHRGKGSGYIVNNIRGRWR